LTDNEPKHNELVEEMAGDLATYVGKGVSADPIISNADPKINIEGIDELLEASFVLSGTVTDTPKQARSAINVTEEDTGGITSPAGKPVGVLDFLSLLDFRLRSLDPVSRTELEVTRGETTGRVNWSETVKQRYRSGNVSGDEFVCQTRRQTFESDNNRVLAALLDTISEIVENLPTSPSNIAADSWLATWRTEGAAYPYLSNALENIYMQQFDISESDISHRTLQNVLGARNPLYQEAAVLLAEYRRLKTDSLSETDAKNLLSMKLFAPKDTDPDDNKKISTLFELYWIFRLLDLWDNVTYKQIKSDPDLIALWEDDTYRYRMYNDWKGNAKKGDIKPGSELLTFKATLADVEVTGEIDWPNGEPGYLERQEKVLRRNHFIDRRVFDRDSDITGYRQPDIILLRTYKSTNQFAGVFIGEVKWSTNTDTVKQGLQEILEYGADAKLGRYLRKGEYANQKFVSSEADPTAAPEMSLGLFVGHSSLITQQPLGNLQIRGYDDPVANPFDSIALE
jgi:hypothetical protein